MSGGGKCNGKRDGEVVEDFVGITLNVLIHACNSGFFSSFKV